MGCGASNAAATGIVGHSNNNSSPAMASRPLLKPKRYRHGTRITQVTVKYVFLLFSYCNIYGVFD